MFKFKKGLTTTFLYIAIVSVFIPLTARAYTFTNQLDYGDHGADVSALQQVLKDLSFFSYPEITGFFGSVTQTAVQAFQSAKNIVSSGTPQTTGYGRVGSATLAALNGENATSAASTTTASTTFNFFRNLQLHDSGEDVRELQKFLNAQGFLVATAGAGSPGNETDYFGLATLTALAAFQIAHSIEPPAGFFGPQTRVRVAALSVSKETVTNTIAPPDAPASLKIDRARSYEIALSWTTVEGATSYTVKRKEVDTNEFIIVGTATTTSFTDTSVDPRARYTYVVTASNAGGESQPSSIISAYTRSSGGGGGSPTQSTPGDTTAPVFSSIASTTDITIATITWTTDELSNSKVVYGPTSSYGTASTSATLTTNHSINLTGLIAGSTYHFAVVSADAQGNTATSSDYTFATEEGSTIVFLLAGQSNAVGRADFDSDEDYPSGTLQWGRFGADDGTLITANSPLQHSGSDSSPYDDDIGFSVQFALDYIDASPNDRLIFVPSAVGGTSLSSGDWQQDGTYYDDAVDRVNAAITAAEAVYDNVEFGGVLWHQGESDIGNGSYQSQLIQVISDIRSDITAADSSTPFVLGTLGTNALGADSINTAIGEVPNNLPYTKVVDGRTGLTLLDTYHYNAASLRTLGSRYYSGWQAAQIAAAAVPDQVTSLSATPGSSEIALSWSAPSSNGSPITDYIIEVSEDGGAFSVISDGTSTSVSYSHSGLDSAVSYTYRVSAVNAIGTGVVSGTTTSSPLDIPSDADIITLVSAAGGIIYDPTYTAGLYENRDGTGDNPSTGDPVGYMVDRVGNTNTNVSTSNDDYRPTYTADGLLRFDGTNDRFDFVTAHTALTSMTNATVFMGVASSTKTLTYHLYGINGGLLVFQSHSGSSVTAVTTRAGTPTVHSNNGSSLTTRGQLYTALQSAPTVLEARGADFSGGGWSNLKISLSTAPIQGDIGPIVIMEGADSDDRDSIRLWIQSKIGL